MIMCGPGVQSVIREELCGKGGKPLYSSTSLNDSFEGNIFLLEEDFRKFCPKAAKVYCSGSHNPSNMICDAISFHGLHCTWSYIFRPLGWTILDIRRRLTVLEFKSKWALKPRFLSKVLDSLSKRYTYTPIKRKWISCKVCGLTRTVI